MSSHEEATETMDGVAMDQADSVGREEEDSEMIAVNLLQNMQSLQ